MNKYLTETYDSCGRPYLSLPLPQLPCFNQDRRPTLEKEEIPRGVVVIDMYESDESDNKIVFEI